MSGIWSALRYGSAKIKIFIIFTLLIIVGGAGALIMGIANMSMLLLGIGAAGMIIGLLVIFSVSFNKKEVNAKKVDEGINADDIPKMGPVHRNTSAEAGIDRRGANNESLTEPQRRLRRDNNETRNTSGRKEASERLLTDEEEKEFDKIISSFDEREAQEARKRRIRERAKSGPVDIDDRADGTGTLNRFDNSITDTRVPINIEYGDVSARRLTEEENQISDTDEKLRKDNAKHQKAEAAADRRRDLDDEQELVYQVTDKKDAALRKKLLKVKPGDKKYIPVFVDSCKSLEANRTPAMIQMKGKDIILMLLENKIRSFKIPKESILDVTYAKNVEERYMETYELMKEDKDLYKMYEDLLPSFYQVTDRRSTLTYKNQYILGEDLAITARSMKRLIGKFDFRFHLFDSMNLKGEYSDYFKMAYENRILWTDNCISQTDYQNRTRAVLQMMVDDSDILEYDFVKDAELMIRYKLITEEYADFYQNKKHEKLNAVR